MRTSLRSVVDAILGRVPALASAQIGLGGRSTATSAQSWLFWLVLLLTGASVFILGCACAIVFFADHDCSAAGYNGCSAGMFVLAPGGVLLILIAAVAVSYRDWNSVDYVGRPDALAEAE